MKITKDELIDLIEGIPELAPCCVKDMTILSSQPHTTITFNLTDMHGFGNIRVLDLVIPDDATEESIKEGAYQAILNNSTLNQG